MFAHSLRCSCHDKQEYTHVGIAVSCVTWAFSHYCIRGLESYPKYFVVVGILRQEIELVLKMHCLKKLCKINFEDIRLTLLIYCCCHFSSAHYQMCATID